MAEAELCAVGAGDEGVLTCEGAEDAAVSVAAAGFVAVPTSTRTRSCDVRARVPSGEVIVSDSA